MRGEPLASRVFSSSNSATSSDTRAAMLVDDITCSTVTKLLRTSQLDPPNVVFSPQLKEESEKEMYYLIAR